MSQITKEQLFKYLDEEKLGKIKKQDGIVGKGPCSGTGCHPGREDKKRKDNKKKTACRFKQRGGRKIFFHKGLSDSHYRKKTVAGSKNTEKETADHI